MTVWERLMGGSELSANGREDVAGRLAQGLLNMFAISLVISFGVMVFLLAGAIYRPHSTMLAVVPTLKGALEILRLAGSLFSPLLAFVLGYYFHQSTRTAAEAAGAKAVGTAVARGAEASSEIVDAASR